MGVETELDRTVVRLTERARGRALTISASAERRARAAAARDGAVATRQVDEIAAGFTDLARAMAGDGTVLEQLPGDRGDDARRRGTSTATHPAAASSWR